MNATEATESTAPIVADSAPILQFISKPGTEEETRIRCRRVVTLIGSRPGCKLTLRGRAIDPVHLAIVNNGSEVVAADLVTAGGSRLNGLKMEHERLSDGDILAVGPWEFQVDLQPQNGVGAADAHPFGLEPTPQVIALEHIATHRILQPNRQIVILGRRSGCDISVSDPGVSRAHAILFTYFGYPAVFDLLSRNQTLVNDSPVSFQMLHNDDVVTVGQSRFRVRLVESSAPKAAKSADVVRPSVKLAPEPPSPDMISIQATEGSQRWHIADHMTQATPRRSAV